MALPRAETLQILVMAYAPTVLMTQFGLPSFFLRLYTLFPLGIILTSFALPMATMIYTSPDSSVRLAVIPLIAASCIGYHHSAQYFMPDRAAASALSGPFILLFLASTNALVLQRLYLDRDGKERSAVNSRIESEKGEWQGPDGRSPSRRISLWSSWGWAARVIFSYRDIGSKRQAKNVPRWDHRNPNYVPSRARFLAGRALAVLGAFVIVDFLNHQPPPPAGLFAIPKSFLFPPTAVINAQMVITRLLSTALFWFGLRMTIGLIYNFASIVGVATFLTTPADWPPYFGSPYEAYTLRRFWAVFWHSGLRNPLTNTASFFVHSVLRIPRGTLLGRYLHIFITFCISGTMHLCLDTMAGIPAHESNARTLFIMQGVGIMLEDFAEWAYRTVRREQAAAKGQAVQVQRGEASSWTWQRILGYAWVVLFLAWTTPSWSYANFRHDGDQLLPVSLYEWVKS